GGHRHERPRRRRQPPRRGGNHRAGHRDPSSDPRRRLPQPHRSPGGGRDRGPGRDRGGERMRPVSHLVSDSLTIVRRNLIKIKRVPDLLVFTTLQPIMFVLLFGFVFGALTGGNPDGYREFMMAGIFAQTVVFGGTFTGFGIDRKSVV